MKIINQISMNKRIGFALIMFFSFTGSVWAQTYYVTTTANSGFGSLQDAITQVNAHSYDVINFNISTSDSGYDSATNTWTIKPNPELPTITSKVTIDGYTQPGSFVNTLGEGDNAVLTIVLNGSNYGVGDGLTNGNGLHFGAGSDGSIVRGLCINQWLYCGILIEASAGSVSGISIIGNFIGTNAQGTQEMANAIGIGLSGLIGFPNTVANTIIGTIQKGDRNIIAGSFGNFEGWNGFNTFSLTSACIGTAADANTMMVNNYIGVDKTGTQQLGNSLIGIALFFSTGSTVGTVGTLSEQTSNIISGHLVGIYLIVAPNLTIQNNFIGTDIAGLNALGNSYSGFLLLVSAGNSITGNLISGNGAGVKIGDSEAAGSNNNVLTNNLIGTDLSGIKALGNSGYGIEVYGAQNVLGDVTGATKNTICSNDKGGILLSGYLTTNNTIINNNIGVDFTGIGKLPNGGSGVQIGQNGGKAGALANNIGM